MRVHPISLALRYLKGRRSVRGAPYRGAPLFASDAAAAAVLRRFTGRDFGTNAADWGDWLRRNRWAFHADTDDPRRTAPDCSRCHGCGRIKQRSTERGRIKWQRIKCPACQGRGIDLG
jgi:hypothetical protein